MQGWWKKSNRNKKVNYSLIVSQLSRDHTHNEIISITARNTIVWRQIGKFGACFVF